MSAHPAPAPLQPLARRLAEHHAAPSLHRDPAFIRRYRPLSRHVIGYFSPDVRGIDNVPAEGPVLVVGNHSTVFYYPDAWVIADHVIERRGIDSPTYILAFDLLFAIPGVEQVLRRAGGMPADPVEAAHALSTGAAVVVFPGGDYDACRPWTARDRIAFGGHQGFVRLALRCGVPVVPAVGYGAHHAIMVAARGDAIARALHLNGVRVNVMPLVIGPPFGVMPIVSLPLPAQVTVEFLPAIDWSAHGPDSADDPEIVNACYAEVVDRMQDAMDRLHREHPHPVARGSVALAQRTVRAGLHAVRHPLGVR